RGVQTLAERATKEYEASREKVRQFIHDKETAQVLFTRGTTTSLNWIAKTYRDLAVTAAGEIVICYMEHHSNFILWQH
ncbi:aminotransferase class V-fold PLP-dependent enzyme, partial [Enterococcus faecalis]|uniref:aminotransferase class V-fold PLP-dependent enzyme n=1 Tax=Enterococcus faecalis TaxID=1351 RepID=UPI003D6B9189